MSLFSELKRRNVIRMGAAYVVVAWLLIQVAETIFPLFGFDDSPARIVVILLTIGFVPMLVLAWAFELTPEGIKKESDVDRTSSITTATGKKLDRGIMVVLAIAVGYFAFDKFVLSETREAEIAEAAREEGRSEAVVEAYGERSIAVMAFEDMSPDKDQEYFSDGIAEELLNLLATIRELRVISRSTAFSFKGSDSTLKEIAEKLEVSYILEGSVRKAGDKIRIAVQLIDARTDANVWSETYNRTLDDVFAIQDEISASIVEQLELQLLDGAPRTTKIDTRAYNLYLNALYLANSTTNDVEQYYAAGRMLREVIAIQPDYVAAYGTLGYSLSRMHFEDGSPFPRVEYETQYRELTRQIIEIDPQSVAAFRTQGWVAFHIDKDFQSAAGFIERGLSIDPNHEGMLRLVYLFLRDTGRPDSAIAVAKYILLRDPGCQVCYYRLAWVYEGLGRYGEAADALEDMLLWHVPPTGFYADLGFYRLAGGQPEDALVAFTKESQEGMSELGEILALYDLGRLEEFETRFAAMRAHDSRNARLIASIYAWTGDNDRAFEWLGTMVEEQGPVSVDYIDRVVFEKIKSDERWRELRDQYGFHDVPISAVEIDIALPAEYFDDSP